MKASLAVLAICALCFGASALKLKSSPEARFMSTEVEVVEGSESGSGSMSPASVLDTQQYAALKHAEAEKAVHALHLPGDKQDILSELNLQDMAVEEDAEEEGSDEELLDLAAETEEGADAEADEVDAADTEELESEISAAEDEADTDAVFLQISEEDADEEEEESEEEDEAEDEEEEEADEEAEAEDEDEEADEEESESEDEEEAEEEDESEADEESEEESEDAALLETEGPSPYISPVLRGAKENKWKDQMPDKEYDKTAEKHLLPNPFRAAMKKRKADGKKPFNHRAPKPAAKGRKGGRKGGRKSRKSRKSAKKGKGKRARKGSKKSRKGGKKSKKSVAKKARSYPFDGKDPRKIVTAPHLQDIWDARHKHFIKSTDSLIKELDDGLLEHSIHPALADPNKKCKKGKKAAPAPKGKRTSKKSKKSKKAKKSKRSAKKF